ncbi:hypothetical protein Arub01_19920 [Actinomadura rubrobrunea]|uniref:Uncharacterized protein n=1 Tax=Actinomadura rubrobrunea TaxID=115335 RepID=A0A9W6PVG0_9ACTN|nr:hypothetical protein Arub01_19920 [Actinomadura rubrobrunea]
MLSLAGGALSAGVMLDLVGWRWTSAAALVPLAVCLGVSAAYAVHNRKVRANVERGRDTARVMD